MGAVTVQRPELFHAVVSMVGIYDMLRVEDTSNGAFNVTNSARLKTGAVRGAVCLFAAAPCQGRHRLSGHPVYHG